MVEAAAELLAEQGVEETTVQQIVRRANRSVGSFYARFDGKEDLLDYLERRTWENARIHWDEGLAAGRWGGLSLAELSEGLVRLLLESSRREAAVRRALRRRPRPGEEPGVARAFRDHVEEGIRELLLGRRAEITHPDPERAVSIGLRVVVGGLGELESVEGLSDTERVGELSRLLRAYLGSQAVEPPALSPQPQVDFFDVWG